MANRLLSDQTYEELKQGVKESDDPENHPYCGRSIKVYYDLKDGESSHSGTVDFVEGGRSYTGEDFDELDLVTIGYTTSSGKYMVTVGPDTENPIANRHMKKNFLGSTANKLLL